jgi:hypothetical protein
MSAQNQVQNQKQVQNQAIASTPSTTPVNVSNDIPAIANNPNVAIILAFAVLIRAILGSSANKN